MDLQALLKSYENKSGGNGYAKPNLFQLKDDGDNALVKILLANEDDVLKFTKEVHMVEINGYKNKVLCTGEGCKCCEAGIPKSLKLMMPLYNESTKQVEIWERGITMIKDIMTMLDEYGDLTQETFKVIRSGKAKSKDTKYSIVYSKKQVETTATNADAPKLTGRDYKLILELSPEQQQEAMLTGKVTWTKKTENINTDVVNTDDIPF